MGADYPSKERPKFPPHKRLKRRPTKGERCDLMVGVDYASRSPKLKRCPNMATVAMKGGPFGHEAWVCESCAQSLEERGE